MRKNDISMSDCIIEEYDIYMANLGYFDALHFVGYCHIYPEENPLRKEQQQRKETLKSNNSICVKQNKMFECGMIAGLSNLQ